MDWLALRKKSADENRPAVLILDDEEGVRVFLTRALTELGYNTLVAADAEAAFVLLANRPHVLLLDVHLPGASGLRFADKVREFSPTTSIILATGDVGVPPTESLRPQVVAYLVKPFSKASLADAVEAGVKWSEEQRLSPTIEPTDHKASEETLLYSDGCCEHCDAKWCVRVSAVVLNGARHLQHYCPRCHRVWTRRERGSQEQPFPYQPQMVK